MKATIVLIANNEIEHYGKKLMLEAHKLGNLGFEMARLPEHISLKQPFSISNIEEFESFFDQFSNSINPINIKLTDISMFPSNVFGYESGCMVLCVEKTEALVNLQNNLFQQLDEHYGECPADYDNDYKFHMTFAIGGAPYENYEKAYSVMKQKEYHRECVFDKLGLLYYDDDNIKPGTYFCYKVVTI